MRHIFIAAAALAVGGFVATAASAQTAHGGAPDRIGKMCKVSTDDNADVGNYGYYVPCSQIPAAKASKEITPIAARALGFEGGAPDRIGNMCKTATDDNADVGTYGFYVPCGLVARAQATKEIAPSAAEAKGFQGGAPNRIGNMCKQMTDDNADVGTYGYYVPCGR